MNGREKIVELVELAEQLRDKYEEAMVDQDYARAEEIKALIADILAQARIIKKQEEKYSEINAVALDAKLKQIKKYQEDVEENVNLNVELVEDNADETIQVEATRTSGARDARKLEKQKKAQDRQRMREARILEKERRKREKRIQKEEGISKSIPSIPAGLSEEYRTGWIFGAISVLYLGLLVLPPKGSVLGAMSEDGWNIYIDLGIILGAVLMGLGFYGIMKSSSKLVQMLYFISTLLYVLLVGLSGLWRLKMINSRLNIDLSIFNILSQVIGGVTLIVVLYIIIILIFSKVKSEEK